MDYLLVYLSKQYIYILWLECPLLFFPLQIIIISSTLVSICLFNFFSLPGCLSQGQPSTSKHLCFNSALWSYLHSLPRHARPNEVLSNLILSSGGTMLYSHVKNSILFLPMYSSEPSTKEHASVIPSPSVRSVPRSLPFSYLVSCLFLIFPFFPINRLPFFNFSKIG